MKLSQPKMQNFVPYVPYFAFQMLIQILVKFPLNLTFKFKVVLSNNLTLRRNRRQGDKQYKQTTATSHVPTHNIANNYLINEVQLTLLKYLPLRTLSRLWGFMTSLYLPTLLRPPILGSYSRLFNCQLSEAEIDDFRLYPNLRQFFTRSLKPGLRPIAPGDDNLVSPVDGTVLHFGRVREGNIEQIKGVHFTTRSFLGPQNWPKTNTFKSCCDNDNVQSQPNNNTQSVQPAFNDVDCSDISDRDIDIISNDSDSENETLINYTQRLKVNQDNCLYTCVIYLAPGDYHRFHSPASWNVHFRRHFPGYLFSVHPSFVGRVKGLFTINERVSYMGHWHHGFISMTAVGATNVGSVKTYIDPSLKTNKFNWRSKKPYNDFVFERPFSFGKGDAFGHFNLGSTIVLLFEAPRRWRFTVQPGDKVKYGQLLFKPKVPSSNQAAKLQ